VNVTVSDGIASSVLSFALKFYQALVKPTHERFIFSPLSIMTSIATLMFTSNGDSVREMAALFGQDDILQLHQQFSLMLQDIQQSDPKKVSPLRRLDSWHNITKPATLQAGGQQLKVINGLFVQTGALLRPGLSEVLKDVYNTDVIPIDSKTDMDMVHNVLNKWSLNQTRRPLWNLQLKNMSLEPRVIAVNDLHFKAALKTRFVIVPFKKLPFYQKGYSESATADVTMMSAKGNYPYYEDHDLGCRIIGLSYVGDLNTLYIIQPLNSSDVELDRLQAKLSAEVIELLISKIKLQNTLIILPKFVLAETLDLKSSLESLGVRSVFEKPPFDELALAFDSPGPVDTALLKFYKSSVQLSNLYVSEIIHTVQFYLYEDVTTASGSVDIETRSSGQQRVLIDTPFIILLRNDLTKLPLFYGMVKMPKEFV
ncbi:hypothetical protein KR222_009375, partial [Zaprionus bogoriensis]